MTERSAGGGPGPLDELFPGMREPAEPLPRADVHPRVLEVDEPGEASLVLACWSDPGGARALHTAVRQRVEAALLAQLSRPPSVLHEVETAPEHRWLRLAVFAEIDGDVASAVRAFGMQRTEPSGPGWRRALAYLRREAHRIEQSAPDEPTSAWQAPIARPSGEAGERLTAVESALAREAGDEAWGAAPGAPMQRLAAALAQHGLGPLEPTIAALRRVEEQIVQREVGPIRWMGPMTFQALCDAAAATAQVDLGRTVQWAACEPDEAGLAPPPLVRVQRHGQWQHLPLGLVMLRWLVMPLQPGEDVPPFADWLADQLG